MCFSAEASFTASTVLFPAGLYCVRRAFKQERSLLALACIPLMFGAQQFCEGLVWVGLRNGNRMLTQEAALWFLFFALFLWPFWVPFSAAAAEPRGSSRRLLTVVGLLALVGGWALYAPVVLDPERRLDVHVVHHSIQYDLHPAAAFGLLPGEFWTTAYLASICCPLLLSHRGLRVLAVTLAAAGVISYVAYRYAFESVWCFFAAAISLQLCYRFRPSPRPDERRGVPSAAPPADNG